MYTDTAFALRTLDQKGYRELDPAMAARGVGARDFWKLYRAGQLVRLWSAVHRRSSALQSLGEALAGRLVRAQRPIGLRDVSLSEIQGSEGRNDDFDVTFRPLRPHHRDRWLNIFAARQRGAALPPVELIQVGERYFVRDGHHRISVARALGQEEIEANVTVWEL